MHSSQPRIAIIGAGPAGLTLGVLLHKRGVQFTIFELRQKPTDEELSKPSGMLDLHDESGLAALKECGLFEKFRERTAECAESQKISDMDGNILYKDEGELSERPEISRHALTRLLSSHLPEETIKWNHKLLSAAISAGPGESGTELDFGTYGKLTFDLVVGADGAWSQVRRALTDVKPGYAGIHNVTATVRNITTKYPHLAELVGRGSFSALGWRHGVMSQRGPQDSARMYVFLNTADDNFGSASGIADQTADVAKRRLLDDVALLGRCGPTIKELVTVACDEDSADNPGAVVDIKPLYTLPIGTSWGHKSSATLVGDAAHLMCPWAGEGVNLAMWDSLLLAHTIIKAYKTAHHAHTSFQAALDPLMKKFEIDMWARAKEKAEETYSNGEMLFGEDGARAFTEFMMKAYGATQEVTP